MRATVEEDILLKQYAHASDEEKPRFNWSDFAAEDAPALPGKLQIKIEIGGQVRDYNVADVADTVGGALTDLLLSRKEENSFNDENQRLVAGIARSVTEDIVEQTEDSSSSEITFNSFVFDLLSLLSFTSASTLPLTLIFYNFISQFIIKEH